MVNSIIFALSLVSAAAAQIVTARHGYEAPSPVATYMPAAPTDAGYNMAGSGHGSPPMQASSPEHTIAPVSNAPSNDAMSYGSFQNGGYKNMDCGYGHRKGSSGRCEKESWYNDSGCYVTIIINNGHGGSGSSGKCDSSPHTVTKTEVHTVTHTMTQVVPTTVVVHQTEVKTQTDKQVVTSTKLQPTTRVWVSTEIVDQTKTVEHTLTATETKTEVNVHTQSVTATATLKETETAVVTQTELHTVVEPTTQTKVWVSTEVIDNTKTVLQTNTATVTAEITRVETSVATATATQTEHMTVTDISTVVQPTTYVSTWVKTQIVDNTKTVLDTITSTIVHVATSTETQKPLETAQPGLSDCLNTCKSNWWLTPGSSVPAPASATHAPAGNDSYGTPSYSSGSPAAYGNDASYNY